MEFQPSADFNVPEGFVRGSLSSSWRTKVPSTLMHGWCIGMRCGGVHESDVH